MTIENKDKIIDVYERSRRLNNSTYRLYLYAGNIFDTMSFSNSYKVALLQFELLKQCEEEIEESYKLIQELSKSIQDLKEKLIADNKKYSKEFR